MMTFKKENRLVEGLERMEMMEEGRMCLLEKQLYFLWIIFVWKKREESGCFMA